jgi:hypothetical protein
MSSGPIRLTGGSHTALRPASDARITGGFWASRRRTNAEAGIPQGSLKLEEAGNLSNLRAAADGKGGFTGDFQFQDSDVHKWLETASWQLADQPGDTELTAHIDDLVLDAADPSLTAERRPELLGGTTVVTARGEGVDSGAPAVTSRA